jgi:hypothetical protein
MNPCSYPSPKLDKMPVRVTALSFDLCVLYYRATHVPYSSLSSKKSGNEGDYKSYSKTSEFWGHRPFYFISFLVRNSSYFYCLIVLD